MLGKKPPPVIGNLTSTWGSVLWTAFADAAMTSPRSPLDDRINQSPRGIHKYNLGGVGVGVGLGIVAALEKSGCEIQANYSKPPTRSNPIPVKPPISASSSNTNRFREKTEFDFDYSSLEEEEEEDYTFVTRHGPNNKPYTTTRVYCNEDTINLGGLDRRVCGNRNRGNCAVFNISPPARFADDVTGLPGSDFLSCCHLCRKKLHGKDIYMYRGEKAFCSDECRYREIVMDERKEQYYCSSEVNSRSSASDHRDSRSPNYANGDQIFSTGILAI